MTRLYLFIFFLFKHFIVARADIRILRLSFGRIVDTTISSWPLGLDAKWQSSPFNKKDLPPPPIKNILGIPPFPNL